MLKLCASVQRKLGISYRMRLLVVLAALFLFARIGYGCKCAPPEPPCAAAWRSPVIFLGTVTDPGASWATFFAELKKKLTPAQVQKLESGDDLSNEEGRAIMRAVLPPEGRMKLQFARTDEDMERLMQEYFPILSQSLRRVRFNVLETFQGDHMNEREVFTGQGYGDCGFDFEKGRTYLVYTYKDTDTGRLETGICTRTHESSGTGEEVDYLREFRSGNADTRVIGFVLGDYREWPGMMWGGQPKSGLTGVEVTLRSGRTTQVATTDHMGRFAFSSLIPGSYEISANAIHGEVFLNTPRTVRVPARGCAEEVLILKTDPR